MLLAIPNILVMSNKEEVGMMGFSPNVVSTLFFLASYESSQRFLQANEG
jgi:hypothetical protein